MLFKSLNSVQKFNRFLNNKSTLGVLNNLGVTHFNPEALQSIYL